VICELKLARLTAFNGKPQASVSVSVSASDIAKRRRLRLAVKQSSDS
jgi:hypothetical protein